MNESLYFNKSRRRRNFLVLLLILCLIAAGFKLFYSWKKVHETRLAQDYLSAESYVESEQLYTSAHHNRTIRYQEMETNLALEELSPVTTIQKLLSIIAEQANEAADNDDFAALITEHHNLSDLKANYQKAAQYDQKLFNQSLAYYKTDDLIRGHLELFRKTYIALLAQNTASNSYHNEDPKVKLLQLPAELWANDPQSLSSLLQAYDTSKLTAMQDYKTVQKLSTALTELSAMDKEYAQYAYKTNWLLPIAEQLMISTLKYDLKAKNYSAFITHAGESERFVNRKKYKSETTALINNAVKMNIAAADQLVKQKKYSEAIALYKAFSPLAAAKEAIQNAEYLWAADEPVRILKEKDNTVTYSNLVSGTNKFSADIYVAAIAANKRIVFGTISRNKPALVVKSQNMEASPGQLSISSTISPNGLPVVVMQSKSRYRNAVYSGYEVTEKAIKEIFLFDADDYKVSGTNRMLVYNPVGKGDGQTAIFQYVNGRYSFDNILKDYTDISLSELTSYRYTKVRFTGNIVFVDPQMAIIENGDSYVILRGNYKFSEGRVTVTGTFDSFERLQKGEYNFKAPKVTVSSMN